MCVSTIQAKNGLHHQPYHKRLKNRHIIYAIHILQALQAFHSEHSDRLTMRFFLHIQSEVSTQFILENKDPHTQKTRSILRSLMDIKKYHPNNSKKDSFIYLICSPWHRHNYIGETEDIQTRIHSHLYHAKSGEKRTPLYNLLRKNGRHNFSIISIPIHPEIRKIMEKKLILHFQPSMNVKYRTNLGEVVRNK